LLLEEYGVKFEDIPEKNVVLDAFFCFEMDSMKIQKGEILTPFSGSENKIIRNIKSTALMYNALIFKEQAKVKGVKEKG
jgi:hypothetical protein